ncbi:sigma-70 family RNA polymerase sigma factor, partial [Embleya sp. NPDC005575]|uniref:RNA polymerase sigma factor n=1 Tax=Embleya sp. NPDC005575 TaxID=3156892 RepID=UPI0033B47EEF
MAREDDAATPDPSGDASGGAAEATGSGARPPFVPGQRGVHHPRAYDGDLGPEPAAAQPTQPRTADTAAPDPFAPGPGGGHCDAAPDADTGWVAAFDGPPDGRLADLVRAGDGDAYGLLYQRHVGSVRRFARTCTRTPEAADDLCAEAFARTLQALRSGRGPKEAFRAYLLTTVRHVAGDWTGSDRREWLTEDFTAFESAWENQDRVVKADDARLALQAFQNLPERSRMVLWHVDIEGEQAVQVAPLVGENPDNVRKILERARQELRDNYFVAFATGGVKDENCKKFTRYYGRHIRNRMDSEKRRESIDAHLKKCSRCNETYAEMVDVRDRYGPIALALIGITAPIFLSGTAVAAGTAAAAAAVAGGMGLAAG